MRNAITYLWNNYVIKDDHDEAINMLNEVESKSLDQWFEQKKKGEGNSERQNVQALKDEHHELKAL